MDCLNDKDVVLKKKFSPCAEVKDLFLRQNMFVLICLRTILKKKASTAHDKFDKASTKRYFFFVKYRLSKVCVALGNGSAIGMPGIFKVSFPKYKFW